MPRSWPWLGLPECSLAMASNDGRDLVCGLGSGAASLYAKSIYLRSKSVLMPGDPQFSASNALFVAAAFSERPVRPIRPLRVQAREPSAVVDALGKPQHLRAIAEHAVVFPVGARCNRAPVEVRGKHGAECYGSGSQILRSGRCAFHPIGGTVDCSSAQGGGATLAGDCP